VSEQGSNSAVTIAVQDDISILHVAARRGAQKKVEGRGAEIFGAALPSTPTIADVPSATIVWTGPGQWLIVREQTIRTQNAAELADMFGRLSSVVDVSDSRVLVQITGKSAGALLSKCMPIDLHDREFKPGSVAITHCFHVGVTLWRTTDGSGYKVLCARSYAQDFVRHLRKAA
jgi:methylglutamate dehydrogenase subunit D